MLRVKIPYHSKNYEDNEYVGKRVRRCVDKEEYDRCGPSMIPGAFIFMIAGCTQISIYRGWVYARLWFRNLIPSPNGVTEYCGAEYLAPRSAV
jgi:hypothetical protein